MTSPILPKLHRARGFTLIEVMVTVGIAATLAGVALPSIEQVVLRARRVDVLLHLSLAQLAQERARAVRSAYGTLDEIGAAGLAHSAHYSIAVVSSSATGYDLLAEAQGNQARDRGCRYLRLKVEGPNTIRASGSTNTTANAPSDNDRCWQRGLA